MTVRELIEELQNWYDQEADVEVLGGFPVEGLRIGNTGAVDISVGGHKRWGVTPNDISDELDEASDDVDRYIGEVEEYGAENSSTSGLDDVVWTLRDIATYFEGY